MLVSRNYLLMILDEEKGKLYSRASAAKDLGLIGAMLMDLYLRGKILVERKKIRVIDPTPTGDELLDDVLEILDRSKKIRKLNRWLGWISRRYKTYYYAFFKRLEKQEILKIKVKKTFKIFESKRFYLQRAEVKLVILEQIQNAIVNNLSPSIDLLCLLSLLEVSGLIKVYIAKEFRKQFRIRINELIYSGNLNPRDQEMIISITKAIKEIIAARQATVTVVVTAAVA
ncbi:MAG: GPP34 family phosphoprotein [Promethearchaeota archaeon]